jgi:hypothetical protein
MGYLLGIANALDGMSRAQAARLVGIDRQSTRPVSTAAMLSSSWDGGCRRFRSA